MQRSSVTVTLNPLSADQLNKTSLDIGGTVSDTNVQFTVNNATATINSDGTWTASGVPVNIAGTAVLDAEITNGTAASFRSGAGMMRSLDSAAAITSGSQEFIQIQPPVVVMKSYQQHFHDEGFTVDVGRHILPGYYDDVIQWNYEVGGSYNAVQDYPMDGDYGGHSTDYIDLPAGEAALADAALDWLWPVWQSAAVKDYRVSNHEVFSDEADTQVMIRPQGQETPGRTNVYIMRACASEVADPTQWFDGGDVPLPPEWLQIKGQTLVNSGITNENDGSVWGLISVVAPSGENVEVTPVATQWSEPKDYTFDVQICQLYQPLVDNNRDGNITYADVDATTPAKPFRFWLNDSQESGDVLSDGRDSIPGYGSPNYARSQINGRSDLVNYFPVTLCLSNALAMLPVTNGFEYHLSQSDSAVKFVYSGLTLTNAFDYLTDVTSTGYGTNFDQGVTNADTILVGTTGTKLDTNWLAQIQTSGGTGVILLEGCVATTQPLMLEIWHTGQKLGGVPLYLNISGVEQMYRWVNLRGAIGAAQTHATDTSEPTNNPDALGNGKNFVFVHGYNVTEAKARGWNAEMFKRLYQSGSRAKFYAVVWQGSESYNSSFDLTPDYHTNVANAFLTAPYLQSFLAGLTGETTMAGHSLGNMVCLSAISDSGATPAHYFMIDAAVPMEAIDGGLATDASMVHPEWMDYTNRLWASKWFQLFSSGDARSTLTWNDRLSNFGGTAVYNFYSSGEEVLREDTSAPPSGALSAVFDNALNYWNDQAGLYVWVWQEKLKGRCGFNGVIGSDHGGWKFNLDNDSGYERFVNGLSVPIAPVVAAFVSSEQLQTNAFFDLGNSTFSTHPDFVNLPSTNGNTYAQANRNRILSDSIPALTLPVGANYVSNLDVRAGGAVNFDMQTLYENGWPQERPVDEAGKWHHSDIRDVAYPYNYKFFNQIVNLGNLQ